MPLSEGIHVALISPIDPNGQVAEAYLQRLLADAIDAGVQGLSVLGSTGDGPHLPAPLRRRVQTAAVRLAAGRVPVWSGVMACEAQDALTQIQQAADVGIAGILLPIPFYYPLTADEILRFYETVADSSPLPLMLYNIPAFTKASIPVGVLQALMAHPRIVALKDSSRDFGYLQQILATVDPSRMRIFTGADDMLFAAGVVGAQGGVCASANIVPELVVALWRATAADDHQEALRLQHKVARLLWTCRQYGARKAWKAACALVNKAPAAALEGMPAAGVAALQAAIDDLIPS